MEITIPEDILWPFLKGTIAPLYLFAGYAWCHIWHRWHPPRQHSAWTGLVCLTDIIAWPLGVAIAAVLFASYGSFLAARASLRGISRLCVSRLREETVTAAQEPPELFVNEEQVHGQTDNVPANCGFCQQMRIGCQHCSLFPLHAHECARCRGAHHRCLYCGLAKQKAVLAYTRELCASPGYDAAEKSLRERLLAQANPQTGENPPEVTAAPGIPEDEQETEDYQEEQCDAAKVAAGATERERLRCLAICDEVQRRDDTVYEWAMEKGYPPNLHEDYRHGYRTACDFIRRDIQEGQNKEQIPVDMNEKPSALDVDKLVADTRSAERQLCITACRQERDKWDSRTERGHLSDGFVAGHVGACYAIIAKLNRRDVESAT